MIGLGQFRFLAAVVFVLPATVIIEVLSGGEPPLIATSVAGIAIICLVTVRMAGMARRMSEQAERLARLADADVLTGLVNRRRFVELVAARLADPAAPAVPVLLVVLERFSEINDTLGHRVGDELLCAAAEEAARGTISQQNALRSAESYLDYTAFSRSGLVDQLEYEGFSTEDATWGVDRVSVDWNEQAAKSAKSYLEYTAFSRSGLVDQLLYEGFTPEQAEYGVSQTGL